VKVLSGATESPFDVFSTSSFTILVLLGFGLPLVTNRGGGGGRARDAAVRCGG
jgi:hypothetical protein